MSQMTMTLISFYNFDETLFDDLFVPDGVNKDALIYLLLQRYGEFEPIYTDLDYMKFSIKNWSIAHQYTFNKWMDAFNSEFNPIENYDRYEEFEDSGNNSNNSNNDSDVLNKTSGYDSNELVNNDSSNSKNHFKSVGEYVSHHKARIHGNIGVTTSVKMLEEFTQFYKTNSIYSFICDLFADEYLIRLY